MMERRVAVLIHSFFNVPESMGEIEQFLRTHPVLKDVYVDVWKISYYDSERGLDQTKPHNFFTPIFEHDDPNDVSLVRKAHQEIQKLAKQLSDQSVIFDLIGHSLGGLIIRCLVQYFSEKKTGGLYLAGHRLNNLVLLGTANRGSRLASRMATATLPLQLLVSSFKLIHDLADGKIDDDDLLKYNSYQFHQFSWASPWIKQLNKDFKSFKDLRWITVRGITKNSLLSDLWTGWTFWRLNIRRDFPFIHLGPLPNDGIIEARSVPLPGARNVVLRGCAHHELVRWTTSGCGRKVALSLEKYLLDK